MELEFRIGNQADVVAASGSLDAITATELTDFLLTKIGEGHTCLVLDLSKVDFMSSAGLRCLIVVLKESRRRGGDLRLAAVQQGVEKVLTMSGALNVLRAYPDEQEALESFMTQN